jgi:hypothetical protein
MNSYKEAYVKLDPMIRKNPDVTLDEFKEKYPKLDVSPWCFGARKKKVLKQPGYGNTGRATVTAAPVGKGGKEVTDAGIKKFIAELHPTSKMKPQYFKIAKVLMKNPEATHSSLAKVIKKNGKIKKNKNGIITLSDANFYQFRKDFNVFARLGTVKSSGANGKSSAKYAPRKRNGLYRILFEQSSKGVDKKSKDLLNDFITKINEERVANLELIQLSYPEEKLEVRSYAK